MSVEGMRCTRSIAEEVLNVLAGQDMQKEELELAEYVPAGHAIQEEDPEPVEYVPAGQAVHATLPMPEAYWPAGQATHEDAPPALLNPAEHTEQTPLIRP